MHFLVPQKNLETRFILRKRLLNYWNSFIFEN